jgi:hypothetical protein
MRIAPPLTVSEAKADLGRDWEVDCRIGLSLDFSPQACYQV